MSYAANLGRTAIVELLFGLGAKDLDHALARACLQGQLVTARKLFEHGARPRPGAVMGPAETLSAAGLDLLLELGAPLSDEFGNVLAPVALLLQTYARNPEGKHACLALCANAGVELPDTSPLRMASRPSRSLDGAAGQRTRNFNTNLLAPRNLSASARL